MNKDLLTRIEALETLTTRLEQAIIDIRNACLCLAPLESSEEDIPNCEPFMDELPEEPEEHECEDGCPSCSDGYEPEGSDKIIEDQEIDHE